MTQEHPLQARASLSLGQSIYTPEDIEDPKLIKQDRPYSGWLYAGFGLVANQGMRRYDKIELNVGVVGPWAFAGEVQTSWHSFFGLREPEGWSHQLDNEFGIVLFYEQARRLYTKPLYHDLMFDVIPHFGGSVGNVFTYGAAGFTLRLGKDLEGDFGPPRIRPSLPGSGYFPGEKSFRWYIFGGIEGRAVLQNIFLDGNTFSSSHSVDKKHWVGDFQAGIVVQFNRFRVTYSQIFRTMEFDEQDSADEFGAVSISYQF